MKRTQKKIPKTFKNIAEVIRVKRTAAGISQQDLSGLIGYKNGQFVSNVERGLCSIPQEKIYLIAGLIKAEPQELMTAIAKDFTDHMERTVGVKNARTQV